MKKLIYSLLLGAATAVSVSAGAQTAKRSCASHEHLQQQLAEHPEMAIQRQNLEQFTQQYETTLPSQQAKTTTPIYTIPVVVHVLYNTTAQNISDAQIFSQIAILNADFQKLNSDASLVPSAFSGLAADAQVQFCLAQRDPNGAATTGILRKSTTTATFSTNDNAKYNSTGGDDAWDRNSYLNLWVVPALTGGVIGYAQFPGGPAATDGVVIVHSCFGNIGTAAAPFNKGRTGTHEVGHWINLYHIWGDDGTACSGSDLVGDTPNQGDENYGCPSFPAVSCSNGPNGDMFMNYMDYTDDACMYMFTAGQKTRMHAVLTPGGSRASLANSLGCTPPITATCAVPSGLNVSPIATTSATLNWGAVSGATAYNLQWKLSTATTWNTVSNISGTSYNLSGLATATTYNYRVQTVCGSTNSAYTSSSSFTTTSTSSGCVAPTGLTSSGITNNTAIITWNAVGGANSYGLQWKLSTASTWTTITGITNTTYTLTGLAANTAYNYRVRTVCGSTTTSFTSTKTLTTTNTAPACSNSNEPNNTLATAVAIATNTDIQSQIATSTDNDYYSFANTASTPNIKITLSNLPLDYDLKLYRPNGTLYATSQAGSTTSEVITYNAAPVGTYKAYVYGYNGANSTTCYTLRADVGSATFREMELADAVSDKNNITFYPNPASSTVSFDYFSNTAQHGSIQIVDQSGRVVRSFGIELTEGANIPKFDVGGLTGGIYFARFITGDVSITSKLVVVH